MLPFGLERKSGQLDFTSNLDFSNSISGLELWVMAGIIKSTVVNYNTCLVPFHRWIRTLGNGGDH